MLKERFINAHTLLNDEHKEKDKYVQRTDYSTHRLFNQGCCQLLLSIVVVNCRLFKLVSIKGHWFQLKVPGVNQRSLVSIKSHWFQSKVTGFNQR